MELDYSPLRESIPRRVISDRSDLPEMSNSLGALLTTLAILIVTGVLILPVLLSPFIYIFIKNFLSKSGYSAIRLSNFAIKNNLTYQWGIQKDNQPVRLLLKGVVGSNNEGILASNIITGKYEGFSFKVFNPYGKGLFTFMEIQLMNQYPHIVLDGKANNPYISNIGHFFGSESQIHLEGNFDKYFSVYSKAPPVDTLRILSPDMMARMADKGYKFDIEIVEDKLHIIGNYRFSNEEEVKNFFVLAVSLMDKLDRRSITRKAKYNYDAKVS